MKISKFLVIILICSACLGIHQEAHAQKTVERYENGNKKYQGRMKGGVKVGKHQFWYESGEKQKEERYNEKGILILIREWDKEGNLTKDENPEVAFEKLRSKQFGDMDWFLVRDGLSYHKLKGRQVYKPIAGRTNMLLHYATFTMSGKEIDSSFRRKVPINVNLIKGDFIKGFLRALAYFEPGDNGYIRIPSELAYGREGADNVPPNSVLVFQVMIINAQ